MCVLVSQEQEARKFTEVERRFCWLPRSVDAKSRASEACEVALEANAFTTVVNEEPLNSLRYLSRKSIGLYSIRALLHFTAKLDEFCYLFLHY